MMEVLAACIIAAKDLRDTKSKKEISHFYHDYIYIYIIYVEVTFYAS